MRSWAPVRAVVVTPVPSLGILMGTITVGRWLQNMGRQLPASCVRSASRSRGRQRAKSARLQAVTQADASSSTSQAEARHSITMPSDRCHRPCRPQWRGACYSPARPSEDERSWEGPVRPLRGTHRALKNPALARAMRSIPRSLCWSGCACRPRRTSVPATTALPVAGASAACRRKALTARLCRGDLACAAVLVETTGLRDAGGAGRGTPCVAGRRRCSRTTSQRAPAPWPCRR